MLHRVGPHPDSFALILPKNMTDQPLPRELEGNPNCHPGGASLVLLLEENDLECMQALLHTRINRTTLYFIDQDQTDPHFLLKTELDGVNRLIESVKERTPNYTQSRNQRCALFQFAEEIDYIMKCGDTSRLARRYFESTVGFDSTTPPTWAHCSVPQPLGQVIKSMYKNLNDPRITCLAECYFNDHEVCDALHTLICLIRLAVVATK